MSDATPPLPPLLCLPVEIRLRIYSFLLPQEEHRKVRINNLYFQEIGSKERRRSHHTILIGSFRGCTSRTTYRAVELPCISTAILYVNRRIHDEAAEVLYGALSFDFEKDVEAVVPFLQDLTPVARRSVKCIRIVKRALPYVKEFGRLEWAAMCNFLSASMNLQEIHLAVISGAPKDYQEVLAAGKLNKSNFDDLVQSEEMAWADQIASVRGLRRMTVTPIWEHCPPPGSSTAMAFFVKFSASVDGGFRDWLVERMVD